MNIFDGLSPAAALGDVITFLSPGITQYGTAVSIAADGEVTATFTGNADERFRTALFDDSTGTWHVMSGEDGWWNYADGDIRIPAEAVTADMETELTSLGLTNVTTIEVYNDSIAVGGVISIDPPQYSLVPDSIPVIIVSSLGPQPAASRDHAVMFVAVDFDMPSGHIRVWSGVGDITIDSQVYTGVGDLGRVTIAPERVGLSLERKTYQLSGTDISLVPESEITNSFGRSVTEYFGFLDPVTFAISGTPEINWEGRIDATRRIDGPEPVVEINAEHRSITLDQVDGWRYTNEHQAQFYSGDTGFEEVVAIQQKEVMWGGQSVNAGSAAYYDENGNLYAPY